jgi:hypothetical protein
VSAAAAGLAAAESAAGEARQRLQTAEQELQEGEALLLSLPAFRILGWCACYDSNCTALQLLQGLGLLSFLCFKGQLYRDT